MSSDQAHAPCVCFLVLCLAACGDTFVTGSGGSGGRSEDTSASSQTSSGETSSTSAGTTASTTASEPELTCGDGVVTYPPEECDDGPTPSQSGSCTVGCKLARCGDGAVWDPSPNTSFEQCDDGNTTSGDGCSAKCSLETCGGACTLWSDDDCVQGCDPALCEGNSLCASIDISCDGTPRADCVGRCMLYVANCQAIDGFPDAPESWPLRSCVQACKLL